MWRLVARVGVGTAVLAVLSNVVAGSTTINDPAKDLDDALVWRAALVTVCLLGWVALAAWRWAAKADLQSVRMAILGGLLLGYVLNPFSWFARAYVAKGWEDPGVGAILLDCVLWMAVGAAALWLVTARTDRAHSHARR